MTMWLRSLLTVVAASALCPRGWADPPPGSLSSWVGLCDAPQFDTPINLLADAECALVESEVLVPRDGSTYDLLVEPRTRYRRFTFPPDYILPEFCPDSIFYGEDRTIGDFPGRSGFLVGPDLVLTAAHFIGVNDTTVPWTVVFGYNGRRLAPGNPLCLYNHTIGFHKDNVYHVTQIVAHGVRDADGLDLLLLRLDRPVVNRRPVRIRREGRATVGDPLVALGHPDQLPMKIDLLGRVAGVSRDGRSLFTTGIHAIQGNSGSMIYNLRSGYVEGIITSIGSNGEFLTPSGCLLLTHRDIVAGIGPTVTDFASFIPPISPVVSPPDPVLHSGPVGGPVSNITTVYTVTPLPGSGPLDLDVSIEPVCHRDQRWPQISVVETVVGQGDANHAAGSNGNASPVRLTVTVGVHDVPAGAYSYDVCVRDPATGFVDRLVHRFEVGATNFSVTPASGISADQVTTPIDASQQYTLRNLEATAVVVEVRTGADWVTLDGIEAREGATIAQRFSLAPAGQRGDTAALTAGISRRLEQRPYGTYESALIFDNLGGPGFSHGDTTVPIVFHWGTETYESTNPSGQVSVPDGSIEGLTLPVAVTDQFCPETLAITVGPFGQADTTELRLTLTSPDGTQVIVVDVGDGVDAKDEPATIENHAMLVFRQRAVLGTWTLRIADLVPGGSQFTFDHWELTASWGGAPPCH